MREALPDLLAALHSAVAAGDAAQAVAIALEWEDLLVDVPLPPSGISTLQQAVRTSPLDDALAARAHGLLAEQCFEAGQRDAAMAHAEQAQRLAQTLAPAFAPARANALRAAARVTLRVSANGNTTQAQAEAQAQWRLLSFAQSVHGYALADSRRFTESAASYRACLRSTWDMGHGAWGMGHGTWDMGHGCLARMVLRAVEFVAHLGPFAPA